MSWGYEYAVQIGFGPVFSIAEGEKLVEVILAVHSLSCVSEIGSCLRQSAGIHICLVKCIRLTTNQSIRKNVTFTSRNLGVHNIVQSTNIVHSQRHEFLYQKCNQLIHLYRYISHHIK